MQCCQGQGHCRSTEQAWPIGFVTARLQIQSPMVPRVGGQTERIAHQSATAEEGLAAGVGASAEDANGNIQTGVELNASCSWAIIERCANAQFGIVHREGSCQAKVGIVEQERSVNAGIRPLHESASIIGYAAGQEDAYLIHRHVVVVAEMRRSPARLSRTGIRACPQLSQISPAVRWMAARKLRAVLS